MHPPVFDANLAAHAIATRGYEAGEIRLVSTLTRAPTVLLRPVGSPPEWDWATQVGCSKFKYRPVQATHVCMWHCFGNYCSQLMSKLQV